MARDFVTDEAWARLARTVPGGFAGVVYDTTIKTQVLMLTQPARAAEAEAALAKWLPGIGGATVREARWDFAQLVDWYNYLMPRMKGVGAVSSDKDENINRIEFGATSIAARDSVVRALSAFPLPCDLVVVDLHGLVRDF